ncbi:AtpZ/AtpI family protein [Runella sp.]|jgi:hypothetical protein|uniref:AtpZ/AtpI family protein n=1 Tax=Runella sp. TaxID=1960881 RepID=UPI00262077E7|nr:AtpZ/AtpI family protein [Runella sp.]
MAEQPEKNLKETSQGVSTFAKYSGLGFQMLATIGLGVYGGLKLDEWQQNKFPLWTLVLSLGSVAGSLYLLIKQVKNE